jgi:predicted PhzF superfamily epimerase YddE/YHI9
MTMRKYDSADEIDALTGAPEGVGFLYAWAWEDEVTGEVRSRMFSPELGIAEDEATGAAAVRLTAELGRPLRIRQGVGSLLLTKPGPDGTVDLGGRVAGEGVRPLPPL